MGSASKRRAARRRLKQHDRGVDRHNPRLNFARKANRLEAEHQRAKGDARARAKRAEEQSAPDA